MKTMLFGLLILHCPSQLYQKQTKRGGGNEKFALPLNTVRHLETMKT